jgi:hypothetical protein
MVECIVLRWIVAWFASGLEQWKTDLTPTVSLDCLSVISTKLLTGHRNSILRPIEILSISRAVSIQGQSHTRKSSLNVAFKLLGEHTSSLVIKSATNIFRIWCHPSHYSFFGISSVFSLQNANCNLKRGPRWRLKVVAKQRHPTWKGSNFQPFKYRVVEFARTKMNLFAFGVLFCCFILILR